MVLCILQLSLRFALAIFIFDNPCRFFNQAAAVLWLQGEDFVHLTLAYDGEPFPSQAGIHKELLHILEPAGRLIDQIFALPGTIQPPRYRNLLKIQIKDMGAVVQCQRHLCHPQRSAVRTSGKNDILHLAAPQIFYTLLTQHPTNAVHYIGLPTAIRPHNSRNSTGKFKFHFIGKGLKSLNLQSLQVHNITSILF